MLAIIDLVVNRPDRHTEPMTVGLSGGESGRDSDEEGLGGGRDLIANNLGNETVSRPRPEDPSAGSGGTAAVTGGSAEGKDPAIGQTSANADPASSRGSTEEVEASEIARLMRDAEHQGPASVRAIRTICCHFHEGCPRPPEFFPFG